MLCYVCLFVLCLVVLGCVGSLLVVCFFVAVKVWCYRVCVWSVLVCVFCCLYILFVSCVCFVLVLLCLWFDWIMVGLFCLLFVS